MCETGDTFVHDQKGHKNVYLNNFKNNYGDFLFFFVVQYIKNKFDFNTTSLLQFGPAAAAVRTLVD